MSEIRRLNKEDVAEVFPLRMRALQEHPEAFGASYEDEVKQGSERWEMTLTDENRAMFGAFVEGKLMGMVLISRDSSKKRLHRMGIYAMYVAPEARQQGLGERLINSCIQYAKEQDGVQQIGIGVTVGNHAARKLYRRCGFVTWGIDPAYLILENGSVYDLELMNLSL
jgi:RimJ/RimL family protein N-acetyltransferase